MHRGPLYHPVPHLHLLQPTLCLAQQPAPTAESVSYSIKVDIVQSNKILVTVWKYTATVLAAEQPRMLQKGIFHEISRGLVVLPDKRAAMTPPFVPQLNKEAVEMQRRVMGLGLSGVSINLPSCFDLPPPVPDRAHAFAVPSSSSGSSTIKASVHNNVPYGRPRRHESELIRFQASIRRLVGPSRRRSPDIIDLEHTPRSRKRERASSPQRVVKRARHGNNSPNPSREETIFYGGPDLVSLDPAQHDSYTFMERLGQGGQGIAHLLTNRRTESLVVCKVIPHTRSYKKEESELHFLRDALPRHARIISVHCALVRPSETELYMDYCTGGDLTSLLEAYENWHEPSSFGQLSNCSLDRIPEAFIWHAYLQLTEALAFIHYGYNANAPSNRQILPDKWLGVIHRDIKPGNIFLQRAPSHPDHPGPEPYPKIVLADFGLAKQADNFDEPPTSNNWMGTFVFQPPELPYHSPKGDVWSTGAIMFLLMTGYIPTEHLPDDIENPRVVGNLWFGSLMTEQANSPSGLGIRGYSQNLTWCVEAALTENVRIRPSSLQLLCEIELARKRTSVRWDELRDWVDEW
ncbi:MAG: hypothetical protein Q9168_003305 [Polycauliona sp. 1 TL-2023]